ncbi:MAG: hypothetical protein VX237_02480 [Chloroflexota bacterium]|nr:hypothetical protein [Chloroflexota bacterium]
MDEARCVEVIAKFQERLMDADNLKKDDNGRMNYETCWQAMRQEGPAILNVTKHLLTYFQETNALYIENKHIIDRAMYEDGMRHAEREE